MRQGLSLPRVVFEFGDVFLDELQGLPPRRDVDFIMTPHGPSVNIPNIYIPLPGPIHSHLNLKYENKMLNYSP